MSEQEDRRYVIEAFEGVSHEEFDDFSSVVVAQIASALKRGKFSYADAKHIAKDCMSERHASEYVSLFELVNAPIDNMGRGPNNFSFLAALQKLDEIDDDVKKFGFDDLPATSQRQREERVALITFMLTIRPTELIHELSEHIDECFEEESELSLLLGERIRKYDVVATPLVDVIKKNTSDVEAIVGFISERGMTSCTDDFLSSLLRYLASRKGSVAIGDGWL